MLRGDDDGRWPTRTATVAFAPLGAGTLAGLGVAATSINAASGVVLVVSPGTPELAVVERASVERPSGVGR